MTFDAFSWETKHTKAAIVVVVIVVAVIVFHKEERKWLAGILGVSAAAIGFSA